ncbi:MAG: hypothetical protein KDJ99_12775 [Candidatus Competibacteraceae bacterium]|nr:hypothetical protein [Candidatus Competibacteraceae bacterium]
MTTVKRIFRSIRGVSTPIGGVSWEPEGVEEKIVDINYPTDSGLKEELNNVGYKIAWSAEKKLSRRIDLEGWEKVVWEDQVGKQFTLKCSDGLTLIMKKQDSA